MPQLQPPGTITSPLGVYRTPSWPEVPAEAEAQEVVVAEVDVEATRRAGRSAAKAFSRSAPTL